MPSYKFVASCVAALWAIRCCTSFAFTNKAEMNGCSALSFRKDARVPFRQFAVQPNLSLESSIAGPETTGSVKLALKKPRGSTISVEYAPAVGSHISSFELELLSMQIRKTKAAAIWTSDLNALDVIAKEQESAKGDFPGPCLIVFNGDDEKAETSIEKGASAVVMKPSSLDRACALGVDIIWDVSTRDEVQELLGDGYGYSFLVSGPDAAQISEVLPKDCIAIAGVDAMQAEGAEVEDGKALAAAGFSSVLVRNACVGDAEDLPYTQYLVDSITKKSSSTFSMTGLTGSTNGHFGTSSHSSAATKWKRVG